MALINQKKMVVRKKIKISRIKIREKNKKRRFSRLSSNALIIYFIK